MKNKVTKIETVVKEDVLGTIKRFLDLGFYFGEGDNQVGVTIGLLLLLIVSYIATHFALKFTRSLITRQMDSADKQKFISLFKYFKAAVYIIVFFTVLSLANFNITPILAASAALLVGLGLALKELFQDIIGGIYIIMDKSLLIGDIIKVEDKVCRIIEIKLRSTRAITRDDKILIIPNHKFLINTFKNYTQNHTTTREFIKVRIPFGSDTRLVERILIEAVSTQKGVLKNPKPFVFFNEFGEWALEFGVYFFINDSFSEPRIKSELRFKIDAKLRENKIAIPYPQSDIHMFARTTSSNTDLKISSEE